MSPTNHNRISGNQDLPAEAGNQRDKAPLPKENPLVETEIALKKFRDGEISGAAFLPSSFSGQNDLVRGIFGPDVKAMELANDLINELYQVGVRFTFFASGPIARCSYMEISGLDHEQYGTARVFANSVEDPALEPWHPSNLADEILEPTLLAGELCEKEAKSYRESPDPKRRAVWMLKEISSLRFHRENLLPEIERLRETNHSDEKD